jgi:hypothetical protein
LSFPHPETGEVLLFNAPLPEAWQTQALPVWQTRLMPDVL